MQKVRVLADTTTRSKVRAAVTMTMKRLASRTVRRVRARQYTVCVMQLADEAEVAYQHVCEFLAEVCV